MVELRGGGLHELARALGSGGGELEEAETHGLHVLAQPLQIVAVGLKQVALVGGH